MLDPMATGLSDLTSSELKPINEIKQALAVNMKRIPRIPYCHGLARRTNLTIMVLPPKKITKLNLVNAFGSESQ